MFPLDRVSVCAEMVFRDLPFPERLEKIAEAGYSAVEFWGHKGKDFPAITKTLASNGLKLTAIACGPTLVDESLRGECIETLRESLKVAEELGADVVIVTVGQALEDVSRDAQADSIVAGLSEVAADAESAGVKLALEALNTLVDHAGYYLDRTTDAAQLVKRVGSPSVGLLYDIYHMQIMEGNVIATIREYLPVIHHFHSAGVPGRCEIFKGELEYRAILEAIDDGGYEGYFGLEYKPTGDSSDSLVQTRENIWAG